MKLPSWFPVSIKNIEEGGSKEISKKLKKDIEQFLDNVVSLEREIYTNRQETDQMTDLRHYKVNMIQFLDNMKNTVNEMKFSDVTLKSWQNNIINEVDNVRAKFSNFLKKIE